MSSYPFPYLIDQPEDGSVDERAWLPKHDAATPEAAVAEFIRRYEADGGGVEYWEGDGLELVCTGETEVLRATFLYVDENGDEEELTGSNAERVATVTGRTDELRFDHGAPKEEGAAEWWLLEMRSKACTRTEA